MIKNILITIDGPAASGKTTCSKMLANALGFHYVDTGALYRSIAFYLIREGIDINNESIVSKNLEGISISFKKSGSKDLVFLKDEEISSMIRTSEISMAASKISSYSDVRSFLLDMQRELGASKNVVFEGRDMGTIVFPDAEVKFFLDARQDIRAKRRFLQIGGDTSGCSYKNIFEDLVKRDKDDSTRAVAPLKPTENSIFVDSSFVLPSEVVDTMINHICFGCSVKTDMVYSSL